MEPGLAGSLANYVSSPTSAKKEPRFGGNHGYKNTGWLGPQKGYGGLTSTEISIGEGGKKRLYPAINPLTSGEQLQRLLKLDLDKDKIPMDIVETARSWDNYRNKQGKSSFWEKGDTVYPKPPIPLITLNPIRPR